MGFDDPAHGGFDPGAVGHHTDVGEDVINLAVSRELKEELEARGFAVIMTREDENALAGTKAADMQARRDIIGESNADLMISIHMNANGDSSVSGAIAYYYPESQEGQLFAQCVQDQLNAQLKPARDKIINCDKYFVLKAGAMPSIIVEVGFITNADDAWRIQQPEYQSQAVKAIADGVEDFLERRKQPAPTEPQPSVPIPESIVPQPSASQQFDTLSPSASQQPTEPLPSEQPANADCPCPSPCSCPQPCQCGLTGTAPPAATAPAASPLAD